VTIDLRALLDPSHTALVTQECQAGVIGPDAILPELAEAARASVIPNTAKLADAARGAGVAVVHCVAAHRPDRRGGNTNARLFAALRKRPAPSPEVVAEIGVAESDFVSARQHGVGPMSGTGLDSLLRNLGVTTIVAVGVSVNIGITNLVMDAVNLGYQVVLPRDAVAGVPAPYADAVIDNTLALLASVVTTDDVLSAWTGEAS
jgi:nicotinamidase-related amidase